MKNASERISTTKSSAIIWLTLLTWLGVSFWSWSFFAASVPVNHGYLLTLPLKLIHLPWMLFWLWTIHNFWHQTLNCLRRTPKIQSPESPPGPALVQQAASLLLRSGTSGQLVVQPHGPEVVILYTTCDDFEPQACLSCLDQTYAPLRLIICDDSTDEHWRQKIDLWAAKSGSRVSVSRRPTRQGFKAGNLNHVLGRLVHEEFVLLCDADELIPTDFVANLLVYLQQSSVAFVQARHQMRSPPATQFSKMLGQVTNIFFDYSLPLRNRFGFVSCFGHGVIIRRSIWQAIGGFPEMASEDLAFASRALAEGHRGMYVEQVTAEEAYPPSYTALIKKYRRVVEGTIEYFHTEFPRLLRSSKATWTEKLDLLFTYSACYVGLVAIINLIGGMVLISANVMAGNTRLEIRLLVLYLIGPFTPIAPLVVNIPRAPVKYCRLFFSAAIAYASLVPMFAMRGLVQILRPRPPAFEPTGKVGRQPQKFRDHLLTEAVGVLVLCVAIGLRSPAFVPAAGLGLMFILGPLLCLSERNHGLGSLARNSGFIPYAVMIVLFFMWS